HAKASVAGGADGVIERLPETRPTRAAVEFRLRGEQLEVAARATEGALAVLVIERAREGAFSGFLAQHLELVRRQQLLPFVLTVRDFEGGFSRGTRAALAEREQ